MLVLVPPGNHHQNQAKWAIQTFKAHFNTILAGVDDKFPLLLWCFFLEQPELTLYMLPQSRVAPSISAYVHIHGPYAYMQKPFAPIGCTIQAHVKFEDRQTWDGRSNARFILGTLMEHHQCFRVYVTKTWAMRVSSRVHFKHQYITNPTCSPESHVIAAAQQLTQAQKVEPLTKVSNQFTKIAFAKHKSARAHTEQLMHCNALQPKAQLTFQG